MYMQKLTSTIFLTVSMYVVIGFGMPSVAYADIAYTVTPLVIDVSAEARDIIERKISIKNIGSQPVTLYPSVNNISMTDGGGIEAFLPPSMSDRTASLASWTEISRAGIQIGIGETKTVDITFRINPTPVPGTYHEFIGFGFGRNQDEAALQVSQGKAPGSIVSLTVEDKKTTLLKLSRFIIDRFITKSTNQAAVYTIKNPGDEAMVPHGEIILYDNKGVEVSVIPVNAEKVTIPSGEERQFTPEVPTTDMFGKYKAFLSVEYGEGQVASLQDTAFFYVFPLKIIIPIFVALLIIAALIAFFTHKRYVGDDDDDGSESLDFHIRDSESEAKHHDIDLKKQ